MKYNKTTFFLLIFSLTITLIMLAIFIYNDNYVFIDGHIRRSHNSGLSFVYNADIAIDIGCYHLNSLMPENRQIDKNDLNAEYDDYLNAWIVKQIDNNPDPGIHFDGGMKIIIRKSDAKILFYSIF